MKFLIVFVAFFGLAFGSDLFVGSWKEDQYKREGLGDYIYERGLGWFKRQFVKLSSFELTMNIRKEGNTFHISGKKGPSYEDYAFTLVPDNQSRTNADLGSLGGPRKARAEFKGNSLVTYLHKLDNDVVDVTATRTIDPQKPNEMLYVLKDVSSGVELKQTMFKQ